MSIILQAIEFAMEEDDDELWQVLINLSIHKPSEINLITFYRHLFHLIVCLFCIMAKKRKIFLTKQQQHHRHISGLGNIWYIRLIYTWGTHTNKCVCVCACVRACKTNAVLNEINLYL